MVVVFAMRSKATRRFRRLPSFAVGYREPCAGRSTRSFQQVPFWKTVGRRCSAGVAVDHRHRLVQVRIELASWPAVISRICALSTRAAAA
jgi:hypothetical protein